jgi:hypothetical protein
VDVDVDLVMAQRHGIDLLSRRRHAASVQLAQLTEVLLAWNTRGEDDQHPGGFVAGVLEAVQAVARNKREVPGPGHDLLITESKLDHSFEDVERFDEPTVVTRRHRSGTDSHPDLQDAELIVGGARWANQQRPTGPWARAALLIHRTKDGFVGWSGLAPVRPRQVQLRTMQRSGPNLNTPWIESRIRQWYLLG